MALLASVIMLVAEAGAGRHDVELEILASDEGTSTAYPDMEALFDPGLSDTEFLQVIHRLISQCRETVALNQMKQYLNAENCVYLSRRLTLAQCRGFYDTRDACEFFAEQCESKLIAGCLLGLLKEQGYMAPDIARFYEKSVAPHADWEVEKRLGREIMNILATVIQTEPCYPANHWAVDLSGYPGLPNHLTILPFAERIRNILMEKYSELLLADSELLSDLLQLGIDFDLDLIRTGPQLSISLEDFREIAPYLDMVNLNRNGLLMLQQGRYDLFQELFRQRNLVHNMITEEVDLKSVLIFCLVSLQIGHPELVETMLEVAPFRNFAKKSLEDLEKLSTAIQSLAGMLKSEAKPGSKPEITLNGAALVSDIQELVQLLEESSTDPPQ